MMIIEISLLTLGFPYYLQSMFGLKQTNKTFTVSRIFSLHWIGHLRNC